MYAQILAKSGLDTDHAVITARTHPDSALDFCRHSHDFTERCFEKVMNKAVVTLRANCRTRHFSDFWGEERIYLGDGRLLDASTNGEIPNSPSANYDISLSAISALCPTTADEPTQTR